MVDLSLIGPLSRAARRTFATMIDLRIDAQTPRASAAAAQSRDLSATVTFRGERSGRLTLRSSIDTGRRVASALARWELEDEADEICDAVGELASMITAQLWTHPESDRSISCPEVSIGVGEPTPIDQASRSVAIPFTSELGSIVAELVIDRGGGGVASAEATGWAESES